jgi:hypothetical protein
VFVDVLEKYLHFVGFYFKGQRIIHVTEQGLVSLVRLHRL